MAAINDLTKIDLVGERNDGGIDLCIVAEAPIDSAADVLFLVEQKIRNYLREISDSEFRKQWKIASDTPIRILFETRFAISIDAIRLINKLASEAARSGVRLELTRYGAEHS